MLWQTDEKEYWLIELGKLRTKPPWERYKVVVRSENYYVPHTWFYKTRRSAEDRIIKLKFLYPDIKENNHKRAFGREPPVYELWKLKLVYGTSNKEVGRVICPIEMIKYEKVHKFVWDMISTRA
ncbi:hypothetical protein CL634_02285 [bacterium]|nr:hypothetical protein [bacterium]|tara:strand:- start:137 stop:508 length:372 start_codon:yes stop_codon:yes gene_type:complete